MGGPGERSSESRSDRDRAGDAATSGDIETFKDDYHEGTDTQDVLLSAANAAGVPECAAVDR